MTVRTETKQYVSFRDGDRAYTPGRLALFFALAVLLYALPFLLFRPQKNTEIKTGPSSRSSQFLSEDDPAVQTFLAGIPDTADPTVFVKGNIRRTNACVGYSFFRGGSDMSVPDNEPIPAIKSPYAAIQTFTYDADSDAHDFSRSAIYASLLELVAGLPVPVTPVTMPDYPIWSDAYGPIPGLRDAEAERKKRLYHSRDIVGQTILTIDFDESGLLSPEARIRRSCGSVILDLDARKTVELFLSDPDRSKRFRDRRNRQISVFWNADAPVFVSYMPEVQK